MSKFQIRLINVSGAILFWLLPTRWVAADSWALPGVVTNRSGNGLYELVFIFGPPAAAGKGSWQRLLEDSLFIRLYWGDLIAIDLASGKVRDEAWWKARPADETLALRQATDEYLEATWHRLAREYFRPESFEPDPTTKGVQGILLSGQLRLKEALPLLRKIAATERFKSWHAPRWKTGWGSNLQRLAEVAIAEIE